MKPANVLAWAAAITVSTFAVSITIADESADRKVMIEKAVGFLKTVGQSENGSFSSKTGPGVTGLVTAGLLSVGLPDTDPLVHLNPVTQITKLALPSWPFPK